MYMMVPHDSVMTLTMMSYIVSVKSVSYRGGVENMRVTKECKGKCSINASPENTNMGLHDPHLHCCDGFS